MPTAFLLINCDLGTEKQIVSDLKSIDEVTAVLETYGVYDIIAKLVVDTIEKAREIISWKIRKIPHVKSSISLMVTESR